jgi:hypothetical protein
VTTDAPLPFVPDPDEVARLLAVRTVDSSGQELGIWTDDTRPTDVQVAELCQFAAEDLSGRVGTLPPVELYDECRRTAAIQAAALVLLSFYPEAATAQQLPQLTAMYLNAAGQLQDRVWRVPLRLP